MLTALVPATNLAEPCPEVSVIAPDLPRRTVTSGGQSLLSVLKDIVADAKDSAEGVSGLADFMRSVKFRFVSRKLKQVLADCGVSAEYIPSTIRYRGKELVNEFFILNPLVRIRGVDTERSRLQLDEFGLATDVEKLVLDERRFTGVPLAVVDETLQVVVQPFVVDAITGRRCTGCNFVDPSADVVGKF